MNLEVFNKQVESLKNVEFGIKTEFIPDSFDIIPEFISSDQISVELRQRFVSNGLMDNVIIHLSKNTSIALGLWILGSYFQRKYEKYVLNLTNENTVIKEIWIDFRGSRMFDAKTNKPFYKDDRSLQLSLTKFVWTTDLIEEFTKNQPLYNQQKISLYVTNSVEDYFTIEQFYERNILIGFGDIGGGCLAAEFFLNLGLEKSDVNYEYIKYQYAPRNLASENSCEIRAELIPKNQETEDFISENN